MRQQASLMYTGIVAMLAVGIAAAEPLATVTLVPVVSPQERLFDGVIEAVHQSTVSAEIKGRVEEINYDVDDYVAKGAVIVRLRDKEVQARARQARAGLDEARARHKEAVDEHARIKDIYGRKLVAKSELDKSEAGLKAAKSRLDAAAAKLAESEEQLNHSVVKAPYSGYVTQRHVEVGESVNVGQALMTGFSYEHLRATVQIPQAFVGAVRDHGHARVLFNDVSSVDAKSIRVFPYADARGHAFRVRVALPQGEYGVYPGMFVKVAFVIGEHERLLVPRQAVVRRSELTGVYVQAEEGRIHLRQIRVGRRLADHVEILAGLEAGERVVLDPIAAGIAVKQQR